MNKKLQKRNQYHKYKGLKLDTTNCGGNILQLTIIMQIGGLFVVAFGLKLECIICFVLQKYLYTKKGVVNGMKLFAATSFQRAGQSLFAVFQLDIVNFILSNKNNFQLIKMILPSAFSI